MSDIKITGNIQTTTGIGSTQPAVTITSSVTQGETREGRVVASSPYQSSVNKGETRQGTVVTGARGEKGEKGDTGAGLSIIDTLDNESELPSTGQDGDAYLIGGFLYVWSGSTWNNVGEIRGPQGETGLTGDPGADGQEIELQKTATHIQWRYVGGTWADLVLLTEITGSDGVDGYTPVKDVDYFDGADGTDGQEVELQTTATHVQWRYVGGTWTNLIALSEISGTDGTDGADATNIELQKTATHIQWRLVGGTWADLIALSEITGPAGADGTDGVGLPTGGTSGQQLVKQSATDYDYAWQTPAGSGDMLASTYDPTAVAGDAFSMDNMVEGTNTKILTAAERTKLSNTSGTNTGDQDLSNFETTTELNARDTANRNTDNHTSGTTNKVFTATEQTKLSGVAENATANTGDVVGPSSSSNNTIPRYDGTTGKLIKGSAVEITGTFNDDVYSGGTIESTTLMASPSTNFDTINEYYTDAGVYIDGVLIKDGNVKGRDVDADGTKLDGIATGATANSSDATLLARANHTGTQTMSTISNAGELATQDESDIIPTILGAIYPVGSLYTSTNSSLPAEIAALGTWVEFGAGRVMVNQDTGDTDFDTLEETGGAKTHTLTIDEMPSHTHIQNSHNHTQNPHSHTVPRATAISTGFVFEGTAASSSATMATNNTTATNQATTATNQNTGGGGAHNNVQPYIVVKTWKRTA